MAELADARDSKSRSFGNVGSIPTFGIQHFKETSGATVWSFFCSKHAMNDLKDLLVIGTASLDTLHFGEQTKHTVGGAGLYTALAARQHSPDVALCGPRPIDMPEVLRPVAARLTWIGPLGNLADMPRLEIRHHGGGKATLVSASWGAEARFTPTDLPNDLDISAYKYVHVAALSSAQRQLTFLRACRASGAQHISVGTYGRVAYGETETVYQLFREADLCFMNENEANAVFGALDRVQTQVRPEQVICITLAERGAIVFHEGQRLSFSAPPAAEVDPTGAGDTFCGTFLATLAGEQPLAVCGQLAVEAASHMIGFVGPSGLL